MAKKIKKLIDLSPEAVKVLTIEAVKKDTVFKLFAEQMLEEAAVRLAKNDKPK